MRRGRISDGLVRQRSGTCRWFTRRACRSIRRGIEGTDRASEERDEGDVRQVSGRGLHLSVERDRHEGSAYCPSDRTMLDAMIKTSTRKAYSLASRLWTPAAGCLRASSRTLSHQAASSRSRVWRRWWSGLRRLWLALKFLRLASARWGKSSRGMLRSRMRVGMPTAR
jgi:hypothetical protein